MRDMMGLVNQAQGSFPPDWSHSLANHIPLGAGIAQPDPARLAQIDRLHALARDVFYGRRRRINAREERRLQEADAEIGRVFGQMTGILMNSLVGVSDDLSSIGEAKCAPGSKPLVEQIAHRPFAQLSLSRLVQPGLRYIQKQEGAGNDTEDHELDEEAMQVPTLQSIVKRVLPDVEPGLTERRRASMPGRAAGDRPSWCAHVAREFTGSLMNGQRPQNRRSLNATLPG
jgi:hypothetical protein